MARPRKVEITEVGPRDGLQAELNFIPTEAKIRFVNGLIAAGVPRIEFSSFVSPKAIPQLADVVEVFEGIDRSRPMHPGGSGAEQSWRDPRGRSQGRRDDCLYVGLGKPQSEKRQPIHR